MNGQTILAIAWVAAVVTFLFAAVAVWRLRRSAFWARPGPWIAAALLVSLWACCVWSVLIEPELLLIRRVTIESDTWRGPPVRLGLISDTHAGAPHGSRARIRNVLERMNGEHPDVVILLGDYVGGYGDNAVVLPSISDFSRLEAPLGVVGVLGNHDMSVDRAEITDALTASGVRVLANSALKIERPGGAFWIAGFHSEADPHYRPSLPESLSDVPLGDPVIVAMHEPNNFTKVTQRVALTVAGHTHCGQINLPFLPPPVFARGEAKRWVCHLYKVRGRTLYITGGVGTSLLPARFRAPPEITLLTLRAPDAVSAP